MASLWDRGVGINQGPTKPQNMEVRLGEKRIIKKEKIIFEWRGEERKNEMVDRDKKEDDWGDTRRDAGGFKMMRKWRHSK